MNFHKLVSILFFNNSQLGLSASKDPSKTCWPILLRFLRWICRLFIMWTFFFFLQKSHFSKSALPVSFKFLWNVVKPSEHNHNRPNIRLHFIIFTQKVKTIFVFILKYLYSYNRIFPNVYNVQEVSSNIKAKTNFVWKYVLFCLVSLILVISFFSQKYVLSPERCQRIE